MEEKRIDLNEVIELAKKVSGLSKAGMLDINTFDAIVQMNEEAFIEAFKDREDVITHERLRSAEFPYKYSVREQDVEFICISSEPLELNKVYR